MSGYYAANPHYAAPDRSEDRERQERAEETALWYFQSATKLQKSAYDAAMAEAVRLSGDAFYSARDAADKAWRTDTAAARSLFDETVAEVLRTGEVSEETGDRWQEIEDTAEARARASAIMSSIDAAIDAIKAA
ncbi:hypothetical protein ACQR1H_03065 [Bradyrhizobium sp. HKCCYLRH2015]|uniref:hypothetical protein n=1 Tax=Bradyrhizobium sp. HKCCYLRH2015 TaxID=3420742 RepID=UPI003EB6C96C